MADPETGEPCEISDGRSAIVRIAYHQSSVICGTRDSATLSSIVHGDANTCEMLCTRRLLELPMFVAVSSACRNGYSTVRDSHESVATVFGHVEDGMRAGIALVRPVNDKVANVLRKPLKVIDNAVCVGLDFVEKLPSVKLPPGQVYANVKDSVRGIFTSALEMLTILFSGQKDQIKDAPIASKTQEAIEKMAS